MASNMVPNQFYPKYLLANLYYNEGRTKEAYNAAKKIIKMKIKSDAVKDMIRKMQQLKNDIEEKKEVRHINH
jgi:hypothetical protein